MGTVMFGREHDQPGILIEPQHNHAIDINDAKQLSELRNKLWFDCPQFLSIEIYRFIQGQQLMKRTK